MYTHFEKALEQDPAHKEFVEAMRKAILAAGDIPQARRLLRTVFIFQLVGHDRLRSRAEELVWALHLGEREVRIAQRSLELLVQKGALRYAEASEEYLLPLERRQVDLDEALERTRNRIRPSLDLPAILQRNVSLPRLPASRFNARHGTDRQAFWRLFRAAELGDPSAFQAMAEEFSRQVRPYRGDLMVAFVLAETEEELQAVRELAEAGSLDHPRLILGLPSEPASFANEALEVRALDRLRALEPPFSDPTSNEYRQVTARLEAARSTLRKSFQELLQPGEMVFRHQGQVFADLDVKALQDLVDRIIDETVGAPPALSEPALAFLRDRGHARRQRQVALNHLLACRGELALRTDAGVTGRILKAGLVETGILALQSEARNWTSFNLVEKVPDQGLGRAFNQLRQKLVGGADEARTVPGLDLVVPLLEPPHSLTPATVELLLATLFWKWPRELGLCRNWQRAQVEGRPELLEEVVPSAEALFDMVSAPEDWVVLFVDAEPAQKSFLEGILENFPQKPGPTSSLWTAAGEALLAWFEALPPAARWQAQVDPSFQPVCDLLADPTSAEDLRELLEVRLPRALGVPPVFSWQAESEDMLEELIGLCRTLDGLVEARLARLGVGLAEVFAAHAGGDEALEWPARVRRWLEVVTEEPGHTFWQEELRLLAEQVREVDDPIQAATGLLQALGHPPCEQWRHDRTMEVLEVFRAMREEVEWGAYRALKFAEPDPETTVRSLVQPVLKRAGLPEEELEAILVAELELADWPELVEALASAPVAVAEPPEEVVKADSIEGVVPGRAAAPTSSRHRNPPRKSDPSEGLDEPTLHWL
jgi:ribosomal protein L12E/L44/L45/RPP1/RPP2